MSELKTKLNDQNYAEFLEKIADIQRRQDAFVLAGIMKAITGEEPRMWGDSIVGFGSYHYKSKSGQEGDWFRMGFSPRKQAFSIYTMTGSQKDPEFLNQLGKYKLQGSCIHIKRLSDINQDILRKILIKSLSNLR